MTTLKYYDLSIDTPLSFPTGKPVEVDELIQCALLERQSVPEELLPWCRLREKDIDPLGLRKTSKWEGYMSLIIWSLSGRLPLRAEVLRGRQVLMALPKILKRDETLSQLAFGLLPYLLIGFKSHLENRFQADSNRVADIAKFLGRLAVTKSPEFESFLCAHRGKGGSEKFYLVNDVHQQQATLALHLVKAIGANNPWSDRAAIRWFQQGTTELAHLNMFPELFMRYVESGAVAELLLLLKRHVSQLRQLDTVPTREILFAVEDLDPRSYAVLDFLSQHYGSQWRQIDYQSSHFRHDQVVQIALEDTLPLMKRQMPFYSTPEKYHKYLKQKSVLIARNSVAASRTNSSIQTDLVEAVIERFYEMQSMHPTAKALYETAFYYLWGLHAEQSGSFAIGLDRDHDRFQSRAWTLGVQSAASWSTGHKQNVLIYARRNADKSKSVHLRDLSIRQFWR